LATIHYFMTPASPWTYLGHRRLVEMATRHDATVLLRPIDLGGRVFPQSGGLPLGQRAPQRLAYRLVELDRWSRHVGVPLNPKPKHFPVVATDASQRIIAADLAHGTQAALAFSEALMRALWAEDRDLADAATLAEVAATCGLDAARLGAQQPAARDAYDRYTDEAIALQVFGVPWYVHRGVPYWG
jgi:2-hydroxychromene-2-carboxylate isomerase